LKGAPFLEGDKRMIDLNIIERCQLGEEAAYDELYEAMYKKSLWTAYLIAGHMDIAEDIIQEAFLECFRNIKKLNKPELFPVWFNRILVRISWHIVYKEKKKSVTNYDDDLILTLTDDNNDFEEIETKQTNLSIRKAINKLKPTMRMTIILYYYNNMTIKEISSALNCFEGTVKSRLYYAKKLLQKDLKHEFNDTLSESPDYLKGSVY
jgi:RNA polymerase sigma factor (sigma-70 family)